MVQPGANILNAGQDLMSGKMVSPSTPGSLRDWLYKNYS